MKIRIISNGHPGSTRVENAATGERLEHVRAVSWHIDAESRAVACITVHDVELEAEAEDASFVPPSSDDNGASPDTGEPY